MTKHIIDEDVNIDIRPKREVVTGIAPKDITIGDLHANAVKFLYFLVRHGICDISEADYLRFVDIYKKLTAGERTKELVAEFNEILGRVTIVNQDVLVRLIGDETGDRGNDYCMIKLLQTLKKGKAKVEILASNHGVEFVEAYERYAERGNKFQATILQYGHVSSLYVLNDLIDKQLVDAAEVLEIVETVYKPMLKFISYSLDPVTNGITIFSHAAIDLPILKALAVKFNVEFRDQTSLELAATIDGINASYAVYVRENRVNELWNSHTMMAGYTGDIPLLADNAVELTLWNRNQYALDRPTMHNGYPMSWGHGHNEEHTHDNIYGLDSTVGKAVYLHEERYISLISDEVQLQEKLSLVSREFDDLSTVRSSHDVDRSWMEEPAEYVALPVSEVLSSVDPQLDELSIAVVDFSDAFLPPEEELGSGLIRSGTELHKDGVALRRGQTANPIDDWLDDDEDDDEDGYDLEVSTRHSLAHRFVPPHTRFFDIDEESGSADLMGREVQAAGYQPMAASQISYISRRDPVGAPLTWPHSAFTVDFDEAGSVDLNPSKRITVAQYKFRDQLEIINKKARELSNAGHWTAAWAAQELYNKLDENSTQYFNGQMSREDFNGICVEAMRTAHETLDHHRGWKQVLGNLALAIVGLGVGFIVASVLNKVYTGRFSFFKTDSEQKLDALQDAINQIAPAA